MDQQAILDQLRPNYLPDPVSYWPLAIGWWFIIGCLFIAICIVILLTIRSYRKNRYRSVGLKKASLIFQQYNSHGQKRQFAHECNRLLKLVALKAFPRQDIAQLNGEEWLDFLYRSSGNPLFKSPEASALGSDRFKPDQELNVEQLHKLTKSWIKKHHA